MIRKYSFEVTINESIEQLNQQLIRLVENRAKHFSKRKNLLLQYERRNNHYRELMNQIDENSQKKIQENLQLIRRIQSQILDEQRSERQRREEQLHPPWPISRLITIIGLKIFAILSIATMIIYLLNKSNEKTF